MEHGNFVNELVSDGKSAITVDLHGTEYGFYEKERIVSFLGDQYAFDIPGKGLTSAIFF